MRASSKHPRVDSSSVAPPPSSSTGDTTTKESVDLAAATIVLHFLPWMIQTFDVCWRLS